jgi:hypothetical protein
LRLKTAAVGSFTTTVVGSALTLVVALVVVKSSLDLLLGVSGVALMIGL